MSSFFPLSGIEHRVRRGELRGKVFAEPYCLRWITYLVYMPFYLVFFCIAAARLLISVKSLRISLQPYHSA